MDDSQKRRLKMYLKNARFLWYLGPGNQKTTYKWLETLIPTFAWGRYDLVTQHLIDHLGIEGVISRIIVPAVEARFPKETLDALRISWEEGHPPKLSELGKLVVKKIEKKEEEGPEGTHLWRPFVVIDAFVETPYVESWGELAGVWFEEIEPWLKEIES